MQWLGITKNVTSLSIRATSNVLATSDLLILLVIDHILTTLSRYIEIAKLDSLTSEGVITHLKLIFAKHGIPHTVVSDNGPQYSSSSFATFADQYGFCHSLRYPQANGEAERAVQTVKNLLKKSTDPYLALLSYHSTPQKLEYSPAELQIRRKLCTIFPVSQKMLEPRIPRKQTVKERDQQQKEKQEKYYDLHHRAKEQLSLYLREDVWIPNLGTEGKILQEQSQRSYSVITSREGIIRKNRRHLNPLPPQPEIW